MANSIQALRRKHLRADLRETGLGDTCLYSDGFTEMCYGLRLPNCVHLGRDCDWSRKGHTGFTIPKTPLIPTRTNLRGWLRLSTHQTASPFYLIAYGLRWPRLVTLLYRRHPGGVLSWKIGQFVSRSEVVVNAEVVSMAAASF